MIVVSTVESRLCEVFLAVHPLTGKERWSVLGVGRRGARQTEGHWQRLKSGATDCKTIGTEPIGLEERKLTLPVVTTYSNHSISLDRRAGIDMASQDDAILK